MSISLAALDVACPVRHVTVSVLGTARTVSYRSAGAAHLPCVVLAHGIGSASASWAAQLLGFSSAFHVVAWDAPGYGNSDPLPQAAPRAADYGQVFSAWLSTMGVRPALLVGHSLGCLMVAASGVDAAALLISPAQGYALASPELRTQKLQDRLHALHTLGPEGMAKKRAAAMLSPHASAEQTAFVAHNMSQIHPQGYTQAAQMLAHSDLAQLLQARQAALNSPQSIALACGALDTITPAAGVQVLAYQHNLPFHDLGPAGHACPLEAAQAVNLLITHYAS